jgi:hypothetical protein
MFSWGNVARTAPLDRLAAHVTAESEATIHWYIVEQ